MDIDSTTPPVARYNKNEDKSSFDSIFTTWWFWTSLVVIIVIVVVVILILLFATKKTSLSFSFIIPKMISKSRNTLSLYIELSIDNIAFMSIKKNRKPELSIYTSSGQKKIPLYIYLEYKTSMNRWGTSDISPSNFKLGNDGLPVGFLYATVKEENLNLQPVYELILSNENFNHSILSHLKECEFGGMLYKSHSNIPLGYSM